MSIEKIKRVVTKYVSDKHNDMLVIKGGWGVGKTYFWEQLLKEASKGESISKDYYAYVSLFGINNLEELKNTIFAARVNSKTMGTVNSAKSGTVVSKHYSNKQNKSQHFENGQVGW